MNKVGKILTLSLCLILFASSSNAASRMYTTTVKNTDISTVQEAIIRVFSSKEFAVTYIGHNNVKLNKIDRIITLTMFPSDIDVKLMVTQSDFFNGWESQNYIDHLIPLIKTVRNSIDGTPIDLIENESIEVNKTAEPKEKKHGIIINDKDANGIYRIKSIEKGSGAEKSNLAVNDAIIEINGRSMSEYEKEELNTYIDNKWKDGSSLVMLISHNGEHKIITLKKE